MEKKNKNVTKLVLKIAGNVVFALCLVIAIVATFLTLGNREDEKPASLFGISMLAVKTDSMHPTIKVGDLIFINQKADSVDEQDIITFFTTISGERVLNTHRIIDVIPEGGMVEERYETKGDNEAIADPIFVSKSEVIGLYNGTRIPVVGHVINFATTGTGFFVLIVIPLFGYFAYHVVRVVLVAKEYKKEKEKENTKA